MDVATEFGKTLDPESKGNLPVPEIHCRNLHRVGKELFLTVVNELSYKNMEHWPPIFDVFKFFFTAHISEREFGLSFSQAMDWDGPCSVNPMSFLNFLGL